MQTTKQDDRVLVSRQRRYLAASGSGLWANQILHVVVPMIAVVSLNAGAAGVAVLRTTLTMPFVVLGLFVGAVLDRVRRKPVMVAADLVRAAALATVPSAAALGRLTMGHLWVVVLVVGVTTVFFDLGTQSFVKDVVPASLLGQTNAHLATITQTALICAPPLAGWLAGLTSPAAVLFLAVVGFVVSAALMRLLAVEEGGSPPDQHASLWVEVRSGLVFVRQQPVLRTVLLAGFLVNVGTAVVGTLLPVLTLGELGWPAADLGALLGAGGVGGLLGALTAAPLPRRFGAGRSALVVSATLAPLAFTIPLLGAPVPPIWVGSAWALVVYKVGFDAVIMMTFRQQVTPAGLLGRVNGAMRVAFTSAVALGSAGAGLLSSLVGVRGTLWVAAALLCCVWIPVAASPLPRMRSLQDAP